MARPPNSFLETIITFLLPYFSAASMDKHEARSEILDTLAAYETRTRAEMLQAAHVIALGMTTLDVLAEAKTTEMSPSMRLRYRGCANSLNRSTLQTEKALDERLARELPAAPTEMAEPVDDMRQAEIMAAHSGAQGEDRRPAPPRQTRHRPAPRNKHRAGPDVEPRALGQRNAELVAAPRRSSPTVPLKHDRWAERPWHVIHAVKHGAKPFQPAQAG